MQINNTPISHVQYMLDDIQETQCNYLKMQDLNS